MNLDKINKENLSYLGIAVATLIPAVALVIMGVSQIHINTELHSMAPLNFTKTALFLTLGGGLAGTGIWAAASAIRSIVAKKFSMQDRPRLRSAETIATIATLIAASIVAAVFIHYFMQQHHWSLGEGEGYDIFPKALRWSIAGMTVGPALGAYSILSLLKNMRTKQQLVVAPPGPADL